MGGKCFRFCVYLSCYFKELASIFFWSGKFIQKVLWEENSCEEAYVGQSSRRKKWGTLSFYKKSIIFGEEYFFCTHPTIHTAHIKQFSFFSTHFFFFRCESRFLKMKLIKHTYLAAKAKGELSELKRNEQHRASLPTQISINAVEATPTVLIFWRGQNIPR